MKEDVARPLNEIAEEIHKLWTTAHRTAVTYIEEMKRVKSLGDKRGVLTGRDICLYFLSYAQPWKGEDARRVKAELRAILDEEYLIDTVELVLEGKIKPKGPASHKRSKHSRGRN